MGEDREAPWESSHVHAIVALDTEDFRHAVGISAGVVGVANLVALASRIHHLFQIEIEKIADFHAIVEFAPALGLFLCDDFASVFANEITILHVLHDESACKVEKKSNPIPGTKHNRGTMEKMELIKKFHQFFQRKKKILEIFFENFFFFWILLKWRFEVKDTITSTLQVKNWVAHSPHPWMSEGPHLTFFFELNRIGVFLQHFSLAIFAWHLQTCRKTEKKQYFG